jgi:thiamine-phosphate pyrophosphorylase
MRGAPVSIAGVYAILDLPITHPVEDITEALITGGAGVIQLRAKHADAAARRAWAESIAAPCRRAGVALIINDDLELAESGLPGVAGVHLGQTDLHRLGADLETRRRRREQLRARGLVLGVSTHSLAQLRCALADLEPDYLGFGPVYATTSKHDPDPVVGVELLARACSESPVPIVAIGGVDSRRGPELARAGAAAIAAIGALGLAGGTVDIVRARTCALVDAFAAR